MALITVEVTFHAWQAEIFGSKESPIILEESISKGMTFEYLLNRLIDRYPAIKGIIVDPSSGRVHEHVMIIVNDRILDLVGGLQARLKDGDKIHILPYLTGG